MKLLLTALLLTVSTMGQTAATQEPEEVELKRLLGQEWSELTVSLMVDQGCVAPIYHGFRISRGPEGLTVATWQDGPRGQSVGAGKPLDAGKLPQIIESTLKHYDTAVAAKDFREVLREMKTQAERDKAFIAAGSPMGGGAEGIDICITLEGRQRRFRNNFGADGFTELQDWLNKERLGKE